MLSGNAQGSLLYAAIRNGDEGIVREILNSSELPLLKDIRDEEGQLNLLILGIHSSTIVGMLLETYPSINYIDKWLALKNAATHGHSEVIVELLARCGKEVIMYDKADALRCAAEAGHSQAVIEILTHCGNEMSSHYKVEALRSAAQAGHAQVIVEFFARCDDLRYVDHGPTLIAAAEKGHVQVINTLLNSCGDEIRRDDKGVALVRAAKFGHCQVIIELLNRCDNEIRDHRFPALRWAAHEAHIDVLNILLAVPTIEIRAADHNNFLLTETQLLARAGDEERARYQPIIDRLLQIPAVATLAAQQAQQTNTDLAQIAQFGENSMQALNSEESSIVSHLKNHYKSIYDDKGFEVVRAEILSYLEKAYKKSPALDNGIPLPLEYTQNLSQSALESYYKHLIHGAWRYLSDSNPWMAANAQYVQTLEDGRKVAIISDADKELMAYLWIAINDETVSLDKGFTVKRNKKIFAQNIGEMNRAHNHDERAENPEEQQAYLDNVPGIKTTRVDDFEADKPTCVYGVTKRLLESAYGHPRIKPLDPRLMQAWMESLLFGRKEKPEHPDNIVDRLDKLSLDELKTMKENRIDAMTGEAFECHDALKIPKDQLDAFIEKVKTWYGTEEITKERNSKLVINPDGSGFIAEKHNSYVALIQFCAKDPINCFATVLNTYLTARIQALEELKKPDVEMENANTFTPSYDDSSKKRDRDEEPEVQDKCNRLR